MSEEIDVVETPVDTPETSEPAAAEVPTEQAPPPEAISGKMGTLLKREQQFQAKVRAEKEALAKDREAYARDKAEIEAQKARYAKVKENPIEGLKEAGLSYEELTRKILELDTPEAKIGALAEELRALKEERAREHQERVSRETQAQVESGKDQFQKHIFDNVDKYPTLTLYDEARVRAAAWALASQAYSESGEVPTFEAIAQHLEDQLVSEQDELARRRAARQPVPSPPAAPVSKAGVKTLSSSMVSERATPALPSNYHELSRAEQRAIDAEFLAKNLWKE